MQRALLKALYLPPEMGAPEIIFILVIYLLLFGAKGVPSLARTLGKAMAEFRNASQDIQKEILDGANDFKREVNRNNPVKEIKSTIEGVEQRTKKPEKVSTTEKTEDTNQNPPEN